MTDGSKRDEVARDIGWLEGFGAAMWAMCTTQEPEVVTAETCALYDNCVCRLRENVLGIDLPSGEA